MLTNVLVILFFLCMMGLLLWILEGCPSLRAPHCPLTGERLRSGEFFYGKPRFLVGLVYCPACNTLVSDTGEHRMKNPKSLPTVFDDPCY